MRPLRVRFPVVSLAIASAACLAQATGAGAQPAVVPAAGPLSLERSAAVACPPGTRLVPIPGRAGAYCVTPGGSTVGTLDPRAARREDSRREALREPAGAPPSSDPWASLRSANPLATTPRPAPTDPAQIRPEFSGASTVRPEFAASGTSGAAKDPALRR